MNNRRVGRVAAAKRAEMARFSDLGTMKPDQRLMLWTGEPGELLIGTAGGAAGASTLDLGRHEWVKKIEVDFDIPPGDYSVEYCCDPEGKYSHLTPPGPPATPPNPPSQAGGGSDWLVIGVGTASALPRLAVQRDITTPEAERDSFHDQPPLFLRYLRVTSSTSASVTAWRVWRDTPIDLTGRLKGGVSVTRETDGRRLGNAAKPKLSFVLANEDGGLDLRLTPPAPPSELGGGRDASGLSYLRSFARWTLEVKYRGENWEEPAGFEDSTWWPIFSGQQRRRSRSRKSGEVRIDCEAGLALERKTTQPLHEQMRPVEFLRDWLTVADRGQARLIGFANDFDVPFGSVFDESVGRTRIFGGNWWDAVLAVELPEEIRAVAMGNGYVFTINWQTSGDHRYWLVRWDFQGTEIERVQFTPQLPVIDLMVYGTVIIVTTHSNLLYTIAVDDFGSGFHAAQSGGQSTTGIAAIHGGLLDGGYMLKDDRSNSLLVAPATDTPVLFTLPADWGGANQPTQLEVLASDSREYWIIGSGSALETVRRRQRVKLLRLSVASVGPLVGSLQAYPDAGSDFPIAAVMADETFLWAAGLNSDGGQEVAKVAQLGYYLENARVRSVAAGDVPAVNFAEAAITVNGEVLEENTGYSLDRLTGHLILQSIPPDHSEIRASYDYVPTFGFVAVKDRSRWEVVQEVAQAFGLVVRIDGLERLSVTPRMVEEMLYADASDPVSRVLGASSDSEGLPYIIPETITVMALRGFREVPQGIYALSSEDWAQPDGSVAKRWTVTVINDPLVTGYYDQPWVIRFAVQREVIDMAEGELTDSDEDLDSARVITKCVAQGTRRVPAELPQRIEQFFAVGPRDTQVDSSFERVRPVEGTASFDWRPKERIFEKSATDAAPRFNVPFNEPLLLGSSLWAVEYGKLPKVGGWAISQASFVGKRYLKMTDFDHPPGSVEYYVWIEHPESYRIAKAEEFADIHGNVAGGDGFDPATADDVFSPAQFYLRKMNALADSCIVLAWKKMVRYFGQDARGLVYELSPPPGPPSQAGGELRYRTAWPEKGVRVLLKPQDVNGVPLCLDNPIEDWQNPIGLEARLAINRVIVTSDGLRMDVQNFAQRQNFLGVEVIGYPLGEAEIYLGLARNEAGIALYGEVERRMENAFLPNLDFAVRMAQGITERRGEEPTQVSFGRPLAALLGEDEWVRLTPLPPSQAGGSARLVRTVRVVHTLDGKGSRTEGNLE